MVVPRQTPRPVDQDAEVLDRDTDSEVNFYNCQRAPAWIEGTLFCCFVSILI